MRRKDREITDFDEMMKIIAKCDTCRLAMFDDEFPYIIPLNFGTDIENGQLYLYFHSSKEGTKLDLIRKNNKGIRQIADSKFQLCFPFVFFAARIYFVEKISGMLIVFLLINALIKPTFNDMMSEDNFKDIRNDILICLILYVWLLLILVGVI